MIWFGACMLLPWLTAYVLVSHWDRSADSGIAAPIYRACLAFGVGLGLSSCTFFLWLFLGGTPGRLYQVTELAGFATACLLLRVGAPPQVRPADAPLCSAVFSSRWHKLLWVVFGVAMVFALVGVAGVYWEAPLGDWDAWAIWNQRARFLFRAGDQWRQAFSPVFPHVDYPLLLPCTNARCWSYLGSDPGWVPWLVGSLFTFATVGILAAGVCRLRSRSQGLLAGLVLVGTVSFVSRGGLQYADVPLAFFFLATVLLLALYDASDEPRRGLLCLAGLTAALAAWTKNEGWLFVITVFAARWLATWRRAGGRQAMRELVLLAMVAAPVLGIVVLLKTYLGGANDLVTGQGWERSVPRLLDASRYWLVARAFVTCGFHVGKAFVIVLPLCFLLLGRAEYPCRGAAGIPTAGIVVLLMVTGYFGVYVATPYDLSWHLGTSAERLLLHLWPLAILTLFLYLSTPEELLGGKPAAMRREVAPGSRPTDMVMP